MSEPSDQYEVGYGRPPLRTRWKKGQSGNPRKKPRRPENEIEILDRLLLSEVKLTLNGETKRVAAIEAIISRLQLKELSGNSKASRTLLKYRRLANEHDDRRQPLQLRFTSDVGSVGTSESDLG
ncbi:DUF5681 domain-containing protein [Bradyrhizobium sp. McL0616]|uniref:DUF5681 domain-containing protein n=1 Tax=Bradyrhizobium sp. McL0616 TaxID=3415674 RepID=UPI003CE72889